MSEVFAGDNMADSGDEKVSLLVHKDFILPELLGKYNTGILRQIGCYATGLMFSLVKKIANHDTFDVIDRGDDDQGLIDKIAEEFKGAVFCEVAKDAARSCGDINKWLCWFDGKGYPSEKWPQYAREREDFPEPLRRMFDELDPGKLEKLDRVIIKHCIETVESLCDKSNDNMEYERELYYLLGEYFEGSLPGLDRGNGMMGSGLWHMITNSCFECVNDQVDRYNGYLQTVRRIGQDNANKLFEELGVLHFSDWSPEVLQGTLHILETGRTESGNPATIIVRGSSGDRNGAARYFREITSRDTLAVEIKCTDDLSGVVERLERAGVNTDTFNSVVLFGHGSEDGFIMSSMEAISPDPDEWYGKKGMRDLIRRLKLNRLTLVSCHPLVREDKFTPLTVGDDLQRRKGTAPAISVAFSVAVESGLDGKTYTYVKNGSEIELTTGGGDGVWNSARAEGEILETSEMALTRYGLTCRKKGS